ncbi:hypothetical protein E2C01_057696 [Portunus trituberculatus]|uniref:Uncharacterized protein n=1 Tax=Portunus trituberculatus TaxID=210409 RepID=A0A5B7H2P6_PORTR|nr:hypothetical protein [Portunus trituberculatus]
MEESQYKIRRECVYCAAVSSFGVGKQLRVSFSINSCTASSPQLVPLLQLNYELFVTPKFTKN